LALGERFETVLAAARAGADWAWTDLYHDLVGSVRGYVRAQGASDVDDLVGEIFLGVVRSLSRFDGDESAFRSWVFTIAHHQIIDDRRRRQRRRTDPADADTLEAHLPPVAMEAEAIEHLAAAEISALLDHLTADQRQVMTLRLIAGLTLPEAAAVIRRSENATKALQHRALNALRRHLDRHPYPSPPSDRSLE
jgi:RNA polymerase sigma-70 factor, ECF subfamily